MGNIKKKKRKKKKEERRRRAKKWLGDYESESEYFSNSPRRSNSPV